jgi:phosphate starvation-inducible PhoH-like protein
MPIFGSSSLRCVNSAWVFWLSRVKAVLYLSNAACPWAPRIGFNSKAVITGDITQIDLPRSTKSGLRHAIEVLAEVDEISFNFFHSEDVVRHPVVARIVNAYEAWEAADQKRKAEQAAERKRESQEQEQK